MFSVAAGGSPAGFVEERLVAASSKGRVLINEVSNGGSRSAPESFFELKNWGPSPVDLSEWHVYRCNELGLRSNVDHQEIMLTGVVLGPGEIVTVSTTGPRGDAHLAEAFPEKGFGLFLEDRDGAIADRVGVYSNEPWPTQSECTAGRNLSNSLASAFDESWQRIGATGDAERDFVVAQATPAAENARAASGPLDSDVEISELATSGPRSNDDEFIEIVNTGPTVESIGNWRVLACGADGRVERGDSVFEFADAATLRPGERLVLAGAGFAGRSFGRLGGELPNVSAGAMLATPNDRIIDRVAQSSYADSACQGEGAKLPARVDAIAAESYQRGEAGWLIAPRTPGRENATVAESVFDETVRYESRGVAISEIATDPAAIDRQRNFIELGNYGDKAVDISGWTIGRCESSGVRSRSLQGTVPKNTVIAPGKTWLMARAGTAEAQRSAATFDVSFNFLGSGAWVADRAGERVDSVGIFAANEMDHDNVTASPCSKGIALTTYQPDRLEGESFRRSQFTGVDADDFVAAKASPGQIDEVIAADPLATVGAPPVIAPRETRETATLTGKPARVVAAWSGVSEGPLAQLEGNDEREVDPDRPGPIADSSWGSPYQRFELEAGTLEAGSAIQWSGLASGRTEVQLSVWNGSEWKLIGADTPADGTVVVGGVLDGIDRAQPLHLLAQLGPRTRSTLAAGPDGAPEHPDDYDFALSHITDTQYLSESYPEVYAQATSWIMANASARKIAFATHTGDLVQNWVDPAQNELRARREFSRASTAQAILDDAGVPNSVLPGNHDNKRGVSNALFNEFFGPDRYRDRSWFGGTIAADDNSANFSTFERGGAKFLMLSLPYAFGEREIEWALDIVQRHPRHNVVLSTHEHVTPDSGRSSDSRWVSRGDELWERVIAPNRNVVIVLSGHFHGIGQIRTEDAGGIEGHDVVELLADYQEFRTHSGERATGFQRLLQIDLASSTIAVDTFSVRLAASSSFEFDYPQFVPDAGGAADLSNARPWNIVGAGTQGRYDATDDEFHASVGLQFSKSLETTGLRMSVPQAGTAGALEPRLSHL